MKKKLKCDDKITIKNDVMRTTCISNNSNTNNNNNKIYKNTIIIQLNMIEHVRNEK